ncbi:hypothetical protein Tco_0266635 [Tanacetum coccineum]
MMHYAAFAQLTKHHRVYSLQACVWKGMLIFRSELEHKPYWALKAKHNFDMIARIVKTLSFVIHERVSHLQHSIGIRYPNLSTNMCRDYPTPLSNEAGVQLRVFASKDVCVVISHLENGLGTDISQKDEKPIKKQQNRTRDGKVCEDEAKSK